MRWATKQDLGWTAGGLALLALAGCGGGGGGGTPTPAAATTKPPAVSVPSPSTAPLAMPQAATGALSAPLLGDCELFPATAIFNTRIDDATRFPAHGKSAEWVSLVGEGVPFSTDWGVNDNPANFSTYWGMPVNIVDGTTATTEWPVVSFDFATSGVFWDRGYPDKSDCAVADGNGGFSIARSCGAVPAG